MKKLLAKLFLLSALACPVLLSAQTREGQVVSDALALGEGASIPLPQGKWAIKNIREAQPTPVVNFKYYFLENLNVGSEVRFLVVQTGSLNASQGPGVIGRSEWTSDVYSNNASNAYIQSYGTFRTSFKTKNSSISLFSESAEIQSILTLLGQEKFASNIEIAKSLIFDNRVISTISMVRLLAIAIPPENASINFLKLSDEDNSLKNIKAWNALVIQEMDLAFFNKKPQEPLYFSFSGQAQVEIQATDKKLEIEKLLALEAKLKEESQSATKLAEQKRLADESHAKEQLTKEAKQREEALAEAKLKEDKRVAEEAKAKEEFAKQQLAIETKQREEDRALAKLAEEKRLANEAKAKEQLANATTPVPQISKAEQLAQLQLQLAALKAELEKAEPPKIQPAVVTSARRALLIGNNKYVNVATLENATDDAVAMAESLKTMGFEVTVKTDLSLKDMNSAIRNFKASIKKGDEVVFFYAGHGIQIGQSNFLLPIDITGDSEDQIRDDAVLLDRVLDDISEKKAKFTLAMLDACRDNPFKKAGRSVGGGTRGLAPASTANGQMIIFSAGAGQQALDKLGPNDKEKNGLFTRVFIKEMQKSGVSIDRVVRNVRTQVVELAKSVKHDQVPAIYDQVIGEFYFKP